MKNFFVYILANKSNEVLYIGVTNNLLRRIIEHKQKTIKGFSYQYNTDRLIYYEQFERVELAIEREKQLKKWNRSWKNELIEKVNNNWKDLFYEIGGTDELLEIKLGFPLSRE
ncbi:MAG TPA: GIY-YIG nuclease family protein [Ignavibacteria bacterium]|nr:GIY-YIG nuclease family protein [Ignavibacteria bacterium]